MDAEACVATKHDFSKGHSRLGEVYSKLNRYNDAFIAYQKAVNLDATNTDAYKELNKIKQKLLQGGSSTSNSNYSQTRANTTANQTNTSRQGTNNAGTSNTRQNPNNGNGDLMNTVRSTGTVVWNYIARILIQIYDFFESMTPTNRQYLFAFIAIMFIYYVFIYRTRSSEYYDEYHYSNYNNSYIRGFSWSTTIFIMVLAYFIPPQLPELFGQYARPFFGMNWTTFLWLLNMFGNNRGGYNYGNYGRRRRYF